MRLSTRDRVATALVAIAGGVYLLWALGVGLPGLGSTRTVALVVLGLGVAASASAVVPGFDELVHGDKRYLVSTSLVGVIALAAGLWALIGASETGLGVLVATMVVLWLAATIRHTLAARPTPEPWDTGPTTAHELRGGGRHERRR